MPEWRPLRLTAWLQTPVITAAYLSLDGPLFALVMRQRSGWPVASEGGMAPGDRKAPLRLPLQKRHSDTPHWYYACSAAVWPAQVVEETSHWHKRLALHRADLLAPGATRRVEQASGRYRSYRMPVFARHAVQIHWYAVGLERPLTGLLAHLTHLGKKTGQGWGSVLRWAVEPWPEDWSERDGAGQVARAIPVPVWDATDAAHLLPHGYRPPYWMAANQSWCAMPPP